MKSRNSGFTLASAIASIAVLLVACATPPSKQGRLNNEARSEISALVAAYENNDAEGFFARFDDDAFPDFLTFRESVRDTLRHNRQFNIDITIDSILAQGDEIAVQARWRRGFVDQTGDPKKDSGRCEFLLRKRASGGLAVTAIRGDSPF